jgi:hypothetical protein
VGLLVLARVVGLLVRARVGLLVLARVVGLLVRARVGLLVLARVVGLLVRARVGLMAGAWRLGQEPLGLARPRNPAHALGPLNYAAAGRPH